MRGIFRITEYRRPHAKQMLLIGMMKHRHNKIPLVGRMKQNPIIVRQRIHDTLHVDFFESNATPNSAHLCRNLLARLDAPAANHCHRHITTGCIRITSIRPGTIKHLTICRQNLIPIPVIPTSNHLHISVSLTPTSTRPASVQAPLPESGRYPSVPCRTCHRRTAAGVSTKPPSAPSGCSSPSCGTCDRESPATPR